MRTSELTGATLDWAVAKCEGLPLKLDPMGFRKDAPASMQAGWWVWDGEGQNQVIGHRKTQRGQEEGYSPSTNWSQGGPIIERERITLIAMPNGSWATSTPLHTFHQPTPLIAAMRCFVASKLGDEVEIPTELTGESK